MQKFRSVGKLEWRPPPPVVRIRNGPAIRVGGVLPSWSLQLLAIHFAGALWGADQRDPGNPPRQEHCHAVRILGLSVDLSRQLGGCHGLGQVDHVGVGPRTMRQVDAHLPRKVLARCCHVYFSLSLANLCSTQQQPFRFCSLSPRKTTHTCGCFVPQVYDRVVHRLQLGQGINAPGL